MEEKKDEKIPLFDANLPKKIKYLSPEGIKTAEIQFPSDEDWRERESRRRTIVDIRPPNKRRREDADEEESKLVSKLCPELRDLDPYEAGRILDLLSFAVTKDAVIEVNRIIVTVQVFKATTVHVFRMPTPKEQMVYDRDYSSSKPIDNFHVSSVANLRVAEKLYGAMKEKAEGYAGPIPIIHQSEAIAAAFQALKENLDKDVDP
jgi:hypothetical protein